MLHRVLGALLRFLRDFRDRSIGIPGCFGVFLWISAAIQEISNVFLKVSEVLRVLQEVAKRSEGFWSIPRVSKGLQGCSNGVP